MNTPNPLVPQGALERQSKGKSTVRIAIFTIISIHAVFFAGLLMQGCRHEEAKTPLQSAEVSTNLNEFPFDNGYYPNTQEMAQALTPVPPANPPAQPVPDSSAPPMISAPMQADAGGETRTHTIARGDTLARIAKANGVSVSAIKKANPNVDPVRLRPGQTIQVPPPAAAPAPSLGLGFAEPPKSEAPAGGNVYRVKRGETLTRIARQHGTTVKALRAANNLKTDRLLVGQRLRIPERQTTEQQPPVAGAKTPAVGSMAAQLR